MSDQKFEEKMLFIVNENGYQNVYTDKGELIPSLLLTRVIQGTEKNGEVLLKALCNVATSKEEMMDFIHKNELVNGL